MQFPDSEIVCFTPEAFPALSTEACAFLNTPLEQCDPETLRFMFSGLAQYLIDLPDDADTPDPMAVFAMLWARRGNVDKDVRPDSAVATQRDAALPAAVVALPDALDVAPFAPSPTDSCRGNANAPATRYGRIGHAARRIPARRLPRSPRPTWRRHPALSVSDRTLLTRGAVFVPYEQYMPRRHLRYAARASPL
ncbi:MAG TPA: hypothetical protein VMB34_08390 [Acetobacteraceae bacterium]|nr:hypothetical protein [Acetobacteraceae bacterium]